MHLGRSCVARQDHPPCSVEPARHRSGWIVVESALCCAAFDSTPHERYTRGDSSKILASSAITHAQEVCMPDPNGKVIITCALTGGIHGKEANPNLPEQPDEIVTQGVAAWRAGAAILHVHARNPDGSNTMSPAIYRELHERLCAETDASVQLKIVSNATLSVAERLNAVLLAPEMCSLNLRLLNVFIRGQQTFFSNPRSDIVRFADEMRARGVKLELEAYNEAM